MEDGCINIIFPRSLAAAAPVAVLAGRTAKNSTMRRGGKGAGGCSSWGTVINEIYFVFFPPLSLQTLRSLRSLAVSRRNLASAQHVRVVPERLYNMNVAFVSGAAGKRGENSRYGGSGTQLLSEFGMNGFYE